MSDIENGDSPTLPAAVRRFLEPPRFAVIGTTNADGSPHQAVAWYRLDGDEIVFNSRVGRHWPSNILRDRRISVLVADGYDYVELRGEARVDDDRVRGLEVISALTRRYQPDPKAAQAQIEMFSKERRVTFSLRPTKIYTHLESE